MNDYKICIISYKRAKNLKTYETLRKYNYLGDIYIFVSDNDPELANYKELYDNVIVYNKKQIYTKMNIDLYDNFEMLDNCTIARNAIIDWAKENHTYNVIILDDDIKSIRYRFSSNNKLLSKEINCITPIFDNFIDYLNCSNKIKCLSFGYPGVYIGGISGNFRLGYQRLVSQIFILKILDDVYFKATRNEDEIFSSDINYICLSLYMIQQESIARTFGSGGLSDDYKNHNLYVYSFYSILNNSSACKINASRNTCSINWNNCVPKILSGRFKK